MLLIVPPSGHCLLVLPEGEHNTMRRMEAAAAAVAGSEANNRGRHTPGQPLTPRRSSTLPTRRTHT